MRLRPELIGFIHPINLKWRLPTGKAPDIQERSCTEQNESEELIKCED